MKYLEDAKKKERQPENVFDYFERRKVLEKIYEIYGMKAFDEIDDEFIGGDLFEKLMNEYVISHPNEFIVDGDYQYSEIVR